MSSQQGSPPSTDNGSVATGTPPSKVSLNTGRQSPRPSRDDITQGELEPNNGSATASAPPSFVKASFYRGGATYTRRHDGTSQVSCIGDPELAFVDLDKNKDGNIGHLMSVHVPYGDRHSEIYYPRLTGILVQHSDPISAAWNQGVAPLDDKTASGKTDFGLIIPSVKGTSVCATQAPSYQHSNGPLDTDAED